MGDQSAPIYVLLAIRMAERSAGSTRQRKKEPKKENKMVVVVNIPPIVSPNTNTITTTIFLNC